MKKTRLGLAILICLGIFASSCSQYRFIPFFPPEDDTTPYDVGSSEDLESMLETTGNARLTSDIDITSPMNLEAGRSYNIDLNGNKIAFDVGGSMALGNGVSLSISDGDVEASYPSEKNDSYGSWGCIGIQENGTLELTNVDLVADSSAIAIGSEDKTPSAATLKINNSTISANGVYTIGTNAKKYDVGTFVPIDIEIIDSTLIATGKYQNDSCGLLINVPGNLTIRNSKITGDRQGVVVRGGTAEITNSTISTTGKYTGSYYYFDDQWESGDEVPFAALVVGNRGGSAYAYNTSCTVEKSVLTVKAGANANARTVYISSNGNNTASISFDAACDSAYAKTIKDGSYWGVNTYLNGEQLSEKNT